MVVAPYSYSYSSGNARSHAPADSWQPSASQAGEGEFLKYEGKEQYELDIQAPLTHAYPQLCMKIID